MSKNQYLTTQDEHEDNGGTHCPGCNSDMIEGGPGEFGLQASQERTCNNCGASWYDIYRLEGYTTFKPDDDWDAATTDEDERDVEIARKRLAEINADPGNPH